MFKKLNKSRALHRSRFAQKHISQQKVRDKHKNTGKIWYRSPYVVDLKGMNLEKRQLPQKTQGLWPKWRERFRKSIEKGGDFLYDRADQSEQEADIKLDIPKFNFVKPKDDSRWQIANQKLEKRLERIKGNPLIAYYFDQVYILSFLKFLGFLIGKIYFWVNYALTQIKFVLRIVYLNLSASDLFDKSHFIWFLGRTKNRFLFSIRASQLKALTIFVIISFLLISPIGAFTYYQDLQETKFRITGEASQALKHLKSAKDAASDLNFEKISEEFKEAQQSFDSVENELGRTNIVVTSLAQLIPSQRSGKIFLEIGKDLTVAADYLTKGTEVFLKEEISLTNKITALKVILRPALTKIKKANKNLEKISLDSIPPEYQEEFKKIHQALPAIEKNLERFFSLADPLLDILGHEQFKRYLIIFQNNNELRATGGFMGSYALVDIDQGKIKNIEIPGGGTYDLQGSLTAKVISPEPLQLINPIWEFQDSNWWPDFPTSAKKIIWFYNKSNGPTVDGVITINANVMEDLLKVTGAIVMDEYNKVINSHNFITETLKSVELSYDKKENKPKKFLADLAPKVLVRILSADLNQFLDLAEVFNKALIEKNILFYFRKPELEKVILDLGWAGEIRLAPKDYLMVVNSNIGGQKTDLVIEEEINHQGAVEQDGTIINNLTIKRIHQGKAGQLFSGANNVNYLRVYLPKGSELLGASGFNPPQAELFESVPEGYQLDEDLKKISRRAETLEGVEIYNEFDKTVFAGWTQTEPGEVTVINLKYKLPFEINTENNIYSLLVQKQSGSQNTKLKHNLAAAKDWQTIEKYQDVSKADLDTDRFYITTFKNL